MNSNTNCSCGNPSHHHTAEKSDEKSALTDYSPKDKPWDSHRSDVDEISAIYATASEFERLAVRTSQCSGRLDFKWAVERETGEARLKLFRAEFCRVRYCPVCQWRRTLMWQARFYEALPTIVEKFPFSRWAFLTLTVPNCEISDLRETLAVMNKGWNKFVQRKEFKPVEGWIRTTEVTRGKDGSAHPHFHVLLMIPPSMLSGRNYVKREVWLQNWRDCMGNQSITQVDIRTVKPKKGGDVLEAISPLDMLKGAVAETLKYSTKADDLKTDSGWFLELTRQTHKLRFIASGGALKDVLKAEDETNADLVGADGESLEETSGEISFNWQKAKKAYHKRKD